MDLIHIEEQLADHSLVYMTNPGRRAINYLKRFYEVTEIKETNQIMIKYKL